MTIHDLVERVRTYNPGAALDTLEQAYEFSATVHRGQRRRSRDVAPPRRAIRLNVSFGQEVCDRGMANVVWRHRPVGHHGLYPRPPCLPMRSHDGLCPA